MKYYSHMQHVMIDGTLQQSSKHKNTKIPNNPINVIDSSSCSVLSNKKDKIYAKCLNIAKQSGLLFRHGCIATRGGKIIASGCNTYKAYSSRDMFLDHVCSCHAEINVLRKIYHRYKNKQRKLNRIMKKTTLYISRYSSACQSTSSAPCIACMQFIHRFKIKRLIFYMNDQYHTCKAIEYTTTHTSHGDANLMLHQKRGS